MGSEAIVDVRHSGNHIRCFVDATYIGFLSHIPARGRLTAVVIVMVTAQIH